MVACIFTIFVWPEISCFSSNFFLTPLAVAQPCHHVPDPSTAPPSPPPGPSRRGSRGRTSTGDSLRWCIRAPLSARASFLPAPSGSFFVGSHSLSAMELLLFDGLQVFSMESWSRRGCDPNNPRNLRHRTTIHTLTSPPI